MLQVEDEIGASVLDEILELVHRHTGITMTEKKRNLLQARLRSRLRELELLTYQSYVDYLKKNAAEVQSFVNLVTTNETQFFRTPRVWKYFSEEFLPQWTENKGPPVLRIWSAAASSGEEAYSISIACHEHREMVRDFQFQIFGTDISSDVLNVAKKGLYSGKSIQDLKNKDAPRLEKYFSEKEGFYQVKSEIMEPVRFSPVNLCLSPKNVSCFDLVFLRNVLIYFSSEDQEKILVNVRRSMKSSAVLILGESESLARLKTDFKYHMPLVYKT